MILIFGCSAEPVHLQEHEYTSKHVPVPREDTGEKPGNNSQSQSQTEGESLHLELDFHPVDGTQ